ncbi:MAG TPA: carboxylesterase family protein, partial [Armatimonadota bacterium]|nr:carboxylesterase family protein [Armatimonadota bacterium]
AILAMSSGTGAFPGSSGQEMLCLDGNVLTQSPADVFAAGHEAAVPLLVGSNTDEGTIFARKNAPTTKAAYEAVIRRIAPEQAEAILTCYPSKTDADAKAAYTAALGDVCFTATARCTARWHAAAGHPTYRYVFGRIPRFMATLGLGACHGSEIPYVFGNTDNLFYRTEDRALSTAMSACWVAFARTGSPNHPDWPCYAPSHDAYLFFDTTIAAKDGFRTTECDLWDTLAAERR